MQGRKNSLKPAVRHSIYGKNVMSTDFTPRSTILDISPYVPGKSSAGANQKIIKLSSNETPLGPSPKAVESYSHGSSKLFRYPDGSASELRSAIAKQYGLDADRIICGAGSDELLNLIAQAYLQAGDEAIFTEHGFLVYKIAIQAAGGTPVVAKEVDLTANVDEILKVVTPKTKLVFIANPNNPTGTYLPHDEIKRLRAELPSSVGLVLDGAYAEYVRRNDYEAGLELVATTENTIMTRTFSKIYGLAALRIGWAFGPETIIDVLNRIRGPFNLSSPALAAGAAAMEDVQHLELSIEHNDRWVAWLSEELSALGLKVTPSVANFILVSFNEEGSKTAAKADAHLIDDGIIVRRMESYGLPNSLRITIGTEAENKAVVKSLTQFVEQAG